MTWELLLGVALLTVLGAGIGTLAGLGTSTVMVPAFALFLPVPQVLLLVGVIHWFGDVWKMLLFREGVRWRLILLFGAPGVVATWLAASVALDVHSDLLARVLGGFLAIYVAFLLLRPAAQLPRTDASAATGGALYGVTAGLFGVGGAVRSAFLAAFDLPKAVYIATSGAIAIAIDTSRIAAYVEGGATLPDPLLFGLLLFVPASLLGAEAAKKLVNRIPQRHFRTVIAVFLLFAAVKLVVAP
ncbi:MAG: hypothetical protein MAG715_01038 [Methanonatronarchaeales archaeon]|nr:hypothetical protein [Methanonatronarchaeales archaeon]